MRKLSAGASAVLGAFALILGFQIVQHGSVSESASSDDAPDLSGYMAPPAVKESLARRASDIPIGHTVKADITHEGEVETKEFVIVKQHLGDPLRDIDDLPEPITPIRIGNPLRSVDDLPDSITPVRIGNPLRSVDDLPSFASKVALGDPIRSVDALPLPGLVERLGDETRDIN